MIFGPACTLKLAKTGVCGSLCFRKRPGRWAVKTEVCRNTKVVENDDVMATFT